MSVVLTALNPQRITPERSRQEMDRRRRGWRWMSRERQPVPLESMDSTHILNSMRYLHRKATRENRIMFNRSAGGVRPLDARSWSFLVMFDELLRRKDLVHTQVFQMIELVQQVLGGVYLNNLATLPISSEHLTRPEDMDGTFMIAMREALRVIPRQDTIIPTGINDPMVIQEPPYHPNSRSVLVGRESERAAAGQQSRTLAAAMSRMGSSGNDMADAFRYLAQSMGNLGAPTTSPTRPERRSKKKSKRSRQTEPINQVNQVEALTQIGKRKFIIEED